MPATQQYVAQVIANYQRAAEANEETAARLGNVVELSPDDGDEILITADLHGHRRNFNAIRRLAALPDHPRRHLILQEVCHGGPTYANGGCMSHTLLEDVAQLKATFPERVHFLLSNHELAELTDYPILKAGKMLNLMFRMGMQYTYGASAEEVRRAMHGFIRSCPLAVRLPGGLFVCHSLPERTDARGFDVGIFQRTLDVADLREHGPVFQLVWGRDYREENARAFARSVRARVLICGHEPCPEGYMVPNPHQIILDCCSEPACYLLLPIARDQWTQEELVSRIQKL
ncbi:MAG: metallophosphoesterase [Pirellulales bacterium]|nr:metallophosphoesterase [Pirellulales bacterium]